MACFEIALLWQASLALSVRGPRFSSAVRKTWDNGLILGDSLLVTVTWVAFVEAFARKRAPASSAFGTRVSTFVFLCLRLKYTAGKTTQITMETISKGLLEGPDVDPSVAASFSGLLKWKSTLS